MEQKVKKDSFGKNTYTRFATKQDIDGIMQFIHDYWAEDHILARDREIFEFQYVYGDEVCFVLSLDKETEEIEGILGYIPYDTEGERDIYRALESKEEQKSVSGNGSALFSGRAWKMPEPVLCRHQPADLFHLQIYEEDDR